MMRRRTIMSWCDAQKYDGLSKNYKKRQELVTGLSVREAAGMPVSLSSSRV